MRGSTGGGEHGSAQPRSAQPDQLIAQSILGVVRTEHRSECGDKRTPSSLVPREARSGRKKDPVVGLTLLEEPPVKNREVADILGHNGPPICHRRREDVGIRDLTQLLALGHCDHIEAFFPQGLSDGWILLLVEQQPQRRAACCWRFAAAAPCSNNSSFARIQSSISPR